MEKILVVDDQPGNIRIIAEMLKNKYTILAANNGARAIKIAEESLPSLVLLDVMMPELDGFSVCKILKENELTKEIPIIFITAKNEVEDIVKGFTVGGQDYITKPFNPEELIARVDTHIELKKSKEMLKVYIEELKIKNMELDRMSKIDYLTGIANRRFMMEKLKEQAAMEDRKIFTLLMCDIDHFKRVNDTYGHDFGDAVIKEISSMIKNELGENDIVSRWGGEEFLIFLPDTVKETAREMAENIRKKIAETVIAKDKIQHSITITIGIAEYDHSIGISENINNADNALYEGKKEGRNMVVEYK